MWKLYDDLYIGIPSGVRIEGCVVGETWTAVRANGNVGLARTLECPKDPAGFAAGFVGGFLRDAAGHLYWDSPARASVGVAAMNAWYNRMERVAGLEGDREALAPAGKTAYVGDYKLGDVYPLPRTAEFGEAPYKALKDYDNVVIAGEALTTRALPGLLELAGERANVILEGYSVPASALFFAFGMPIREVRGFYPRHLDTVEGCAIHNFQDPTPGVLPFAIRPLEVERIHRSERARAALGSPYNAAKFNNCFR